MDLRKQRERKKLTQREIATMAGISESYYCLIENKERQPSPKVAQKIAKILNFDWTKFYDKQHLEKAQ